MSSHPEFRILHHGISGTPSVNYAPFDSNPIRPEAYVRESLGRMKTITNELGTHTIGYNTPLSRPDSVTGPNGLVTAFTYRGNVASVGTSRLLSGITHTRGAVREAKHVYEHDGAGRITGWERQSIGQATIKSSYDYSLGDELVRAQSRDLTTNVVTDNESWGLDDAGNWLSHTRSSGSVMETRTVNNMNRLTRIGGAGSAVIDGHVNEFSQMWVNSQPTPITPDPVSNGYRFRRTVAVTEGVNTVQITATDQSAQTTTQNWQFNVPAASRSFTYDDNGNTLSDGIRTYTWDAKNRLKTVTKAGVTWKWDYDYRDRRVREYQDNTLTKIFIWSGNRMIQERSATNVVTRNHYAGGFIDGAVPASGTKYQTLTDHLGNVREVLTAAGTVAARYDYTPYQGPVKIGTSTVDPTFLTIGNYYHHAGSGLELALYRAYDPELGRWLSADPIGEKGGVNLYGYVGGDPVNAVDRLGLCPLGSPAAAEAYVGHAPGPSNLSSGQAIGFMAGAIAGEAVAAVGLFLAPETYFALLRKPQIIIGGSIALDETGVLAGNAALMRLLAAGAVIREGTRGLSEAGIALQSHGDRSGSVFPNVAGTNCEINSKAQAILREILSAKDLGIEIWKNGSRLYRDPSTGRGAAFRGDGTFRGFLGDGKIRY